MICIFRSKTNALNISQKMIEMFVRTKHKIDKRHEFALVVVNDDAMWVSGQNRRSNYSQGCPNSVLEGRCPAEFSSNPNQTHLKQLIKLY